MRFTVHAKAQHSYWYTKLQGAPFIYVIGAGVGQPFKVGVAVDVLKRLAVLQTGNPYELHVLQVMPGGKPLEHQFHYKLRHKRLFGEWFEAPAADQFLRFFTEVEQAFRTGFERTGVIPDFRAAHPGPWKAGRRTAPTWKVVP